MRAILKLSAMVLLACVIQANVENFTGWSMDLENWWAVRSYKWFNSSEVVSVARPLPPDDEAEPRPAIASAALESEAF